MRNRSRRSRFAVVLAALLASVSGASAAPPSLESVEELVRITGFEETLDKEISAMLELARGSILGLDRNHGVSAEANPVRESQLRAADKILTFLRQDLSGEKGRELCVRILSETYSQEEVDGQLAFYRSPAGKAVLHKQPLLKTNIGQALDDRVSELHSSIAELWEKEDAVGFDERAQKKTVADLRNLGTAMFSWLTDQVAASAASGVNSTVSLDNYPPISREKLESILVPNYIQSIPEKDGWGNPYELFLNTDNPLAAQVMAIRSPGRDGRVSGRTYSVSAFDPASFDEDIVWVDGFFARWPQKAATRETK